MTADDGAHETNFPGLIPFPDDVPTAPLLRISLQKLLKNDPSEALKLFRACTNEGFFYLDLRTAIVNDAAYSDGHATDIQTNGHGISVSDSYIDPEKLLSDADKLFDIGEEFFKLPTEEKLKYDFKDQGSYFGYKGYGASYTDTAGNKDRNEFYNISKDDILGVSDRLDAPKLLDPHRPLLKSYFENAHAIQRLILARLNDQLGLQGAGDLEEGLLPSLHKLYSRSGDQVRFVRSPPQPMDDRQVALGAHTDFGSVTLLFNRLGGLQILPQPGFQLPSGERYDDWLWVRPLPSHCIVNLGDATVKFSAGRLKSPMHRVVNPPGDQSTSVRYSLAFFSRPEDEVMLKALKGHGSKSIDEAAAEMQARGHIEEEINARDWTLGRVFKRRGMGKREDIEGFEMRKTYGFRV